MIPNVRPFFVSVFAAGVACSGAVATGLATPADGAAAAIVVGVENVDGCENAGEVKLVDPPSNDDDGGSAAPLSNADDELEPVSVDAPAPPAPNDEGSGLVNSPPVVVKPPASPVVVLMSAAVGARNFSVNADPCAPDGWVASVPGTIITSTVSSDWIGVSANTSFPSAPLMPWTEVKQSGMGWLSHFPPLAGSQADEARQARTMAPSGRTESCVGVTVRIGLVSPFGTWNRTAATAVAPSGSPSTSSWSSPTSGRFGTSSGTVAVLVRHHQPVPWT